MAVDEQVYGLVESDLERVGRAVRAVEGDLDATRPGTSVPRVRPLMPLRVTSATLDADGNYPAQILLPDTGAAPDDWSDLAECRVQALDGTLAVGRLWGALIGRTADDAFSLFSPVALDSGGTSATPYAFHVLLAAPINVDISDPSAITVDGVDLSAYLIADVLLLAQDAPKENGVYRWLASGGWGRHPYWSPPAEDASNILTHLPSATVSVGWGDTLRGTVWLARCAPDAVTDTDPIHWQRIDLEGAAHPPCRVASTSNGTLSSAFANGDTLDGVTLATGDRILLPHQTAPAENGPYIVNASGAPTRAPDADTWTKLAGTTVVVMEGTVNHDSLWLCTANAGGTLGSTSLPWQRIDGTTLADPGHDAFRFWDDTDNADRYVAFSSAFKYDNGTHKMSLDADLEAIAAFTTSGEVTGYLCRTADGVWHLRSLTQGSGVTISDSTGTVGNTTIAASPVGGTAGMVWVLSDTFAYTDFNGTAATSLAINLTTVLPAQAELRGVKLKIGQTWLGGLISASNFDLGYSGSSTRYISSYSGINAVSDTNYAGEGGSPAQTNLPEVPNFSGTKTLQLKLTCSNNLTNLTTGTIRVWLLYAVLP